MESILVKRRLNIISNRNFSNNKIKGKRLSTIDASSPSLQPIRAWYIKKINYQGQVEKLQSMEIKTRGQAIESSSTHDFGEHIGHHVFRHTIDEDDITS